MTSVSIINESIKVTHFGKFDHIICGAYTSPHKYLSILLHYFFADLYRLAFVGII